MTINEFLDALKKAAPGFEWTGKATNVFRSVPEVVVHCPITATAFSRGHTASAGGLTRFYEAGQFLGLTHNDIFKIAQACDGPFHNRREDGIKVLSVAICKILFPEKEEPDAVA